MGALVRRYSRVIAMVMGGALLGLIAAAFYYSRTPRQYQSDATFIVAPESLASPQQPRGMAGGALALLAGASDSSDVDLYLSQMRSRDFVAGFLRDNRDQAAAFHPYLSDRAYATIAEGRADPPPELLDAFRENYFRISPTASDRIFKLTVVASTPQAAATLAGRYLSQANAMLRRSALRDSRTRLDYLRNQLGSITNINLREAITSLATEELRKVTLITGSPSYGVLVVDKPRLSVRHTWPRRSIVFALGLLNGALLGLLLHRAWFRRWL